MENQDSVAVPAQLRGQQVLLRPFAAADITPVYLGWLRDPVLMKYSNQRFRRHDAASCRAYLDGFAGSGNFFMAIEHAGALVGTLTVYQAAPHRSADIGLLIGGAPGRGLGRDAWGAMQAYLLQAGVRKVTGGTLRCNTAMVRIMQACGMQPDGVRQAHELVDGAPQDMLYFARFQP